MILKNNKMIAKTFNRERFMRCWVAVGLAIFLSAGTVVAADYVTDGAEIVKASDWKNVESITIDLGEHHIEPARIRLSAFKTYRIVLRNIGKKFHNFSAPELFRALAWRKLSFGNQAEVKVDYINSLDLPRGTQVELYVVPVASGKYSIACTVDDHRDLGMEGTVTIE